MTQEETYDQLVLRAQTATGRERRESFNELIVRFEQAGFRWAYGMLQEREAAEDALQEASLNAFLHLDQLQEPRAFPTWFRQIVINICRRMMQRERGSFLQEIEDEAQPDPSESFQDDEERANVEKAILKLPDRERIVTQLFYYGEYSQHEIADTLAVPVTTVKKRLQYAREHLKGLIGQDFMSMLPGYMFELNGGCTLAAIQRSYAVAD